MSGRDNQIEELKKEIGLLKERLADAEKFGSECVRTEKELWQAKEELEQQEWGIAKTNEAIKVIYKELEKKNAALQKLSDLKSKFVYGLTHELRTPLTIIWGNISLLLDEVPGPLISKQSHILSVTLENIDRLNHIIDNLLDMAKFEAGKIELNPEETDLVALVKQTVAAFKVLADKKKIDLRERFFDSRIMASIDKEKIIQVFTNLIGNAIKFTQEGHVEIGVKDKGDRAECYVADTGIGIPKEDLGRIFERFQQSANVASVEQKGTGLGLSIVKEIITLCGGAIWAESEPDKGTKFIFTIPKATGEKTG